LLLYFVRYLLNRQLLKTRLFAEYWCIQRIRRIAHYAQYKSTYYFQSRQPYNQAIIKKLMIGWSKLALCYS